MQSLIQTYEADTEASGVNMRIRSNMKQLK